MKKEEVEFIAENLPEVLAGVTMTVVRIPRVEVSRQNLTIDEGQALLDVFYKEDERGEYICLLNFTTVGGIKSDMVHVCSRESIYYWRLTYRDSQMRECQSILFFEQLTQKLRDRLETFWRDTYIFSASLAKAEEKDAKI